MSDKTKSTNPPCDSCTSNGLPNCCKPWCYTNINYCNVCSKEIESVKVICDQCYEEH